MKRIVVLAVMSVAALVSWTRDDGVRADRVSYETPDADVSAFQPNASASPRAPRSSRPRRTYDSDEIRDLVYHIRHGSNDRKWASAVRLAELGVGATSALSDIETWLRDPGDRYGRARIALEHALAAMGRSAHPVVERLLKSGPGKGFGSACAVLEKWGPDAVAFAPILVGLGRVGANVGRTLASLGPGADDLFLVHFRESTLPWAEDFAAVRGKALLVQLGPFLTGYDAALRDRTLALMAQDPNAVVLEREIGTLLARFDPSSIPASVHDVARWANRLPDALVSRFSRALVELKRDDATSRKRAVSLANLLAKMGKRGKRVLIDLLDTDAVGPAAAALASSPDMKDVVVRTLERRIAAVRAEGRVPLAEFEAMGQAELAIPSIVPMLKETIRTGSPEQWVRLIPALNANSVDLNELIRSKPEVGEYLTWGFTTLGCAVGSFTVDDDSDVDSVDGFRDLELEEEPVETQVESIVARLSEAAALPEAQRVSARTDALESIAETTSDAVAALASVRPLLRDSEPNVRSAAHRAAHRITGDTRYLRAMLRDLNPVVRNAGIYALSATDLWAVPILVRELPNEAAFHALAGLGSKACDAIPTLRSIADDSWSDERVRTLARETMESISAPPPGSPFDFSFPMEIVAVAR